MVKQMSPSMTTKSGLMIGMGETVEEIIQTLGDLRDAGCEIVTIGQYLQPSPKHWPVDRYYTPEEFQELRAKAQGMGFKSVAAGPFVRSSYNAGEVFAGTTVRPDDRGNSGRGTNGH